MEGCLNGNSLWEEPEIYSSSFSCDYQVTSLLCVCTDVLLFALFCRSLVLAQVSFHNEDVLVDGYLGIAAPEFECVLAVVADQVPYPNLFIKMSHLSLFTWVCPYNSWLLVLFKWAMSVESVGVQPVLFAAMINSALHPPLSKPHSSECETGCQVSALC